MKTKKSTLFIKNFRQLAVLCLFYTVIFAIPVYAEQWDAVVGEAADWIVKLGAAVLAVGGIMFGLGWKNDDADSKTRGLQTMVAGAVTAAMATYLNG